MAIYFIAAVCYENEFYIFNEPSGHIVKPDEHIKNA